MNWIVRDLWLVPALPLAAAGISALLKQQSRRTPAVLAISSMAASFLLALAAFMHVLSLHGTAAREVVNFPWLQFGNQWLMLGWVLDPLTSVMLLMVTFVGLLIFIYSAGYMAHDDNFGRFFCFLALFAGAMLGVVIANSLLLLFMCWELVGLTSYLLIGFWYSRPSAAAAAKKAFLVTRIGDLFFFVGMVWLYAQSGTLLFYDHGAGCLESGALAHLIAQSTAAGMAVTAAIALLIFCGAAGKSGQVPLHVWLPDAMEGPTPVSALIHAATMVAAGVFLIARIYPLMNAHVLGAEGSTTAALEVVTWVGAVTALFGAITAVAQFDIKRILAYSTISQLGYMMMGLGAGGVSVGMFHLITHAFFKALLFLGAGSVIHGCNGEQDIRKMGGLGKLMPVTFATYAVGMLALSGFPLFFSGFWSKDAILHATHLWSVSQAPYYIGLLAALLTAFYMTRQMFYVFGGSYRNAEQTAGLAHHSSAYPAESHAVMTAPLLILAAFAVLLGILGTPTWPWLQSFLEGVTATYDPRALLQNGVLSVMLISSLTALSGIALGWWFYGRRPVGTTDGLAEMQPALFQTVGAGLYVDALYGRTIVRLTSASAAASDWLEQYVWRGGVRLVYFAFLGLAWFDNAWEAYVLNGAFDGGCRGVRLGGRFMAAMQNGLVQTYLKIVGCAVVALGVVLIWGAQR